MFVTDKTGHGKLHDSPRPGRTAVLIIDDHPVAREALSLHIKLQSDLEVCGEACDIASALSLAESARPDLAVVDLSFKNGSGFDLIQQLKERHAALRMLVWSMHDDPLYAERALVAGAMGYVHKGHATREIVAAIRAVLAGQTFVSGGLSGEVLARVACRKSPSNRRGVLKNLTDCELEAFRLIGQGLTTPQIAARMCLSSKTVEIVRLRIKDKLGIDSFPEVIQRAVHWANSQSQIPE
jgi:DNA-binding NarL/FixJ family response regulator